MSTLTYWVENFHEAPRHDFLIAYSPFFVLEKYGCAWHKLKTRCRSGFLNAILWSQVTKYFVLITHKIQSARDPGAPFFVLEKWCLRPAQSERSATGHSFEIPLCAPSRDRTYDRLLKRQLLYRLSYGRIFLKR